jgi:hypothetical protein
VPQLLTSFTSAGKFMLSRYLNSVIETYLALPCLRAAALYDQVRWVQGVLWASLLLSYGAVLVLLGLAYTTVWKTITESPLTHMCLPDSVPSHMYGIYLAPMILDVLVIILIVIKACEDPAALRSGSGTPVVRGVAQVPFEVSHFTYQLFTLIRDGVLYVMVCCLINWY